jgi:hypothetical protein
VANMDSNNNVYFIWLVFQRNEFLSTEHLLATSSVAKL